MSTWCLVQKHFSDIFEICACRLAPVMLVGVALTQIYLAKTTSLSPWKGGGFGMFAVADDISARAWSAECLDENREPCRIIFTRSGGLGFGRTVSFRYRMWPDPAFRALLSERALAQRMSLVSAVEAGASFRLRSSLESMPAPYRDLKLYAPSRLRDPAMGQTTYGLSAVRMHAWRLVLDIDRSTLSLEPLGEPVERGAW